MFTENVPYTNLRSRLFLAGYNPVCNIRFHYVQSTMRTGYKSGRRRLQFFAKDKHSDRNVGDIVSSLANQRVAFVIEYL